MSVLVVLIIVAVVIGLYVMGLYNTLVRMCNSVKEAWSDIEVQMKRRYDMIPNLVETVKGYAKHESGTLEKVIQARNMAMAPHETMAETSQSENMLSGTLKSLFALRERYPELKADKNFLELQRELRDTEDKLQAARRFYNGNVLALNTRIESFPSNAVAGIFHFEKEEFFELAEAEKDEVSKPVKVEF